MLEAKNVAPSLRDQWQNFSHFTSSGSQVSAHQREPFSLPCLGFDGVFLHSVSFLHPVQIEIKNESASPT